MEVDEDKSRSFQEMQKPLLAFKEKIGQRVHELLKTKNDLMQDISEFGQFIQEELLPVYSSCHIARALLWLETVLAPSHFIRRSLRKSYPRSPSSTFNPTKDNDWPLLRCPPN